MTNRPHQPDTLEESFFDWLEGCLLRWLEESDGPLDELGILRRLRELGVPGFERDLLNDSLAMFQCHFILFHALYRLRDRLRTHGEAELEIHTLRIALLPHRSQGPALVVGHDALRDYYLDLDQLRDTGHGEVERLLRGFWDRFHAEEGRSEALRTLELEEGADFATIKRQYRRLASRHHPDRGGDKERLQEINRAMNRLSRLHRG